MTKITTSYNAVTATAKTDNADQFGTKKRTYTHRNAENKMNAMASHGQIASSEYQPQAKAPRRQLEAIATTGKLRTVMGEIERTHWGRTPSKFTGEMIDIYNVVVKDQGVEYTMAFWGRRAHAAAKALASARFIEMTGTEQQPYAWQYWDGDWQEVRELRGGSIAIHKDGVISYPVI